MRQGSGFHPITSNVLPGAPGLSDISARLERRLAWYGLPQFSVEKIEITQADSIVATIVDRGRAVYHEGFDAQTGALRWRTID